MNWDFQPLANYCSKIKPKVMQTSRIVQAVILMMVVALAASCAAGKEYSAKIFAPRNATTEPVARTTNLRFLDLDKLDGDSSLWVQTDIVNGKDTSDQTLALDNLSKTVPSTAKEKSLIENKKVESRDVTQKNSSPIKTESADKSIPKESEPVARTLPAPDGTRNKSTRE